MKSKHLKANDFFYRFSLKFNCSNHHRLHFSAFRRLESRNSYNKTQSGFTVVELLIVIIVISILTAITIVSYAGIVNRVDIAALQSELTNASKKLAIYYTQNGSYPTTLDSNNCPATPNIDTDDCIKYSSGTVIDYSGTTNSFNLKFTKSNIAYRITNDSIPTVAVASDCPAGYILVPGSSTYSTNDFCVMRYEAKNVGGIATSTPNGTPWVNINQTTATTKSAAACSGCHLITEAEWMTLAKNVLSVPSNWSSGTVGTGYIYSGHNDVIPNNALTASANDNDGYDSTGNNASDDSISNGVVGKTQKRTLTLTNGEVIWDMAGNVWEWTAGLTASGSVSQPGISGNAYTAWIDYPNINVVGSLAVDVTPAGTGLINAGSWKSTNGVGRLISNPADTVQNGFLRGGDWGNVSSTGVLALLLAMVPGYSNMFVGFRVSR